MSEQNNNKRIAKNSIFLAARMVVITLISIFTTRFLLRNLGVEDFGVYNVTLGIVALCTFLSPAFSNAIQRYFNFELGKNGIKGAKKVFNSSLLIQVIMVLFIVLLCETVGRWYVLEKLVVPEGRQDAAYWVFQISVISFSLSMLQVPFVASVMAHEKMNFYAIVNILDAILKLAIAIGITYSAYDKLIIYGLLLLGINILNFAIFGFYTYSSFREIRFAFVFDKPLLKGLLSFSGWNLFETIARIGKDQGGNLLLNYYFGPILNAARGITNQVSYAFSSVVDSTVMASRPQMVQEYAKGNYPRSISIFFTLSKGTLLLIFILGLPVFLDTEYILKLWLDSNIPTYSVELIRLSIILLLFDKLASPVTALVHATGKVKRYHLFSGIINIAVLPIAWLFFSLGYNPTSLYIITIFGTLIAQTVFLFIIRDLLPISIIDYLKRVIYPFLIVVIVSIWLPIIAELLFCEGILRLFVVVGLSIIVTSITTYCFALTAGEKLLFVSLIGVAPKKNKDNEKC